MKYLLIIALLSSILFATNDFKSVKADEATVKKVYKLIHPNIKEWKEKLAEHPYTKYKFELKEVIKFTVNNSNYLLLAYNEYNHPDETTNYGCNNHGGWMLFENEKLIYEDKTSTSLADFTLNKHNKVVYIDHITGYFYHGEGEAELNIYKLNEGSLSHMAYLDMGHSSGNCDREVLDVSISKKDLNSDGLDDIEFFKTASYINEDCEVTQSEIIEEGSIIYK